MASLSLPSANAESFKIAILNEELENLQKRLALTTLPDELDGAGWAYGVPLADIQRLLARWKDGYDWRAHEKRLNDALPQFRRSIEVGGFGTLDIHYVHKTSAVEGAIPLLFVHGCMYRRGLCLVARVAHCCGLSCAALYTHRAWWILRGPEDTAAIDAGYAGRA